MKVQNSSVSAAKWGVVFCIKNQSETVKFDAISEIGSTIVPATDSLALLKTTHRSKHSPPHTTLLDNQTRSPLAPGRHSVILTMVSSTVWLLLLVVPVGVTGFVSLTPHSSSGAFRHTAESSTPQQQQQQQRRSRGNKAAGVSSLKAIGVTSSVIETVAKGVLNLALANPKQATVECRINSSARNLVRGNLDQAKVDG